MGGMRGYEEHEWRERVPPVQGLFGWGYVESMRHTIGCGRDIIVWVC